MSEVTGNIIHHPNGKNTKTTVTHLKTENCGQADCPVVKPTPKGEESWEKEFDRTIGEEMNYQEWHYFTDQRKVIKDFIRQLLQDKEREVSIPCLKFHKKAEIYHEPCWFPDDLIAKQKGEE